MKISTSLKQFVDLIDVASGFVARNSTLPILQNLYLKASVDTLTIRATDMEKYIEIETPVSIEVEGAVTINARLLGDILKSLDADTIQLSVNPNNFVTTVQAGKDHFELNGISASEYVALPDISSDQSVTLDIPTFITGIDKTEFTVTEKNFSPVLTGILIKKSTEDLIFVGTDSFRLAEFKTKITNSAPDFTLIIPKTAIADFRRTADFAQGRGADALSLQFSDNLLAASLVVDNTRITMTSLLIQGNFPDYNREEIMPTQHNATATLSKNALDKAIRKISILTRNLNNFTQLDLDENLLTLSSGKTDKGNAETTVEAAHSGEKQSFGINARYISDYLRICESDEIQLKIVDSSKPILFIDPQNANYRYVVRPLVNN